MKKRLAEGMTLMVLLLVLWNMAAHTDRMAEAQIKHFTAFFPTEGNSLEYGNIMKAKIAEVTGAECEELWLSGADQGAGAQFIHCQRQISGLHTGGKKLIRSRGIDSD